MGCTPSKNARLSNEDTQEFLKEIEELKRSQNSQAAEIGRLNEENRKLRYGIVNPGASTTSYEDITKLEEEMEKLKVENETLRQNKEEAEQAKRKLEQENAALKRHSGAVVSQQVKTDSPQKATTKPTRSNLPKVGDNVLCMWEVSMWQYFTATIVSFDVETYKYTIDWDDQDPSGRVIDYFNLALDRIPDEDEVGMGTIVLFPQGAYRGQEGVRLGGQRWHQGKITQVTKGSDGQKRYDGKHTKGEADGKWVTYKGYDPFFSGLTRDQFRIAPNVLDILSAENQSRPQTARGDERVTGGGAVISPCDVYISYSKIDSYAAIQNNEVSPEELPPSYDEVMSGMCDPRDIREQLNGAGVAVNQESSGDLFKTLSHINNAKVFIACLSDHYASDEMCRQEFQYAKKTAKKPVIPVVVGKSFDWMMSVVGLLIAGELYIHFKDKDIQDMKMTELLNAVKKNVPGAIEDQVDSSTVAQTESQASIQAELATPDVFLSYCWSNSHTALQAKQISKLVGHEWSDPRRIKSDLTKASLTPWLDIERLRTSNQGGDESMGMFEQIAQGLGSAKVVIVFVSREYANSDNCRMEFQFALKSLKKPVVPVIVGSGYEWQGTVVGLLVSSQEVQPINLQDVSSDEEYRSKIEDIKKNVKSLLGLKEEKSSYKAPRIGDHVVSHHQKWAYFFATIVGFDPEHLSYTVDWDDGDPTGRVQSYKATPWSIGLPHTFTVLRRSGYIGQGWVIPSDKTRHPKIRKDVGLDQVPRPDEIGVDSRVFFPQGSYGATEGNNTGGMRYHEGVVTRIYKDSTGCFLYDGHHTKGEADGKWVTWRGYDYNFQGLKLDQLRIAPNAMDALTAFKQI